MESSDRVGRREIEHFRFPILDFLHLKFLLTTPEGYNLVRIKTGLVETVLRFKPGYGFVHLSYE